MKLTIGMAVWEDMPMAWATIQHLRATFDLSDTEILVIDNKGSENLFKWVRAWGNRKVRYERYTEVQGTAAPRQQVFEQAKGEYVICIDSHVILMPGSLDKLWEGDCLIHGPMLYDALVSCCTEMLDVWRGEMWGIWKDAIPVKDLPGESFEIWGHGLGLFGSRKDTWLGFNPGFRQFGGEEGYIHEKYRQVGRKVLCLPWMRWNHFFEDLRDKPSMYPRNMVYRVRNYLIGFKELGLDTQPIINHFGTQIVNKAKNI